MKLNEYLQDGANCQSRAVLAYLSHSDGIEESWNDEYKRYVAEPQIARWLNGREQGYIVYLKSKDFQKQINIAFFEHRNSDEIHAVKWYQNSLNPITIETAKFKNVYKNKYDTSFCVRYGEVVKMAEWIEQCLIDFWIEN